MLRLGFEYLSSLELTDLGLPIIEALRDETGLTAHIVIRDGRDVVFVAKAQSHAPIFSSVKVNVGTRLPAYATTHGQVLMGDMTLDELKKLYPEPELERFTETDARDGRRPLRTDSRRRAARFRDQRVVVRARHFGCQRAGAQRHRAHRRRDHDDDSAPGDRRIAAGQRSRRQGARARPTSFRSGSITGRATVRMRAANT